MVKNGPRYNVVIFLIPWHVTFEEFDETSRQDIYKLMCDIDKNGKEHGRWLDSISSECGRNFPNTSTSTSLNFIGDKIIFIETWLKTLENKYIWILNDYEARMNELF